MSMHRSSHELAAPAGDETANQAGLVDFARLIARRWPIIAIAVLVGVIGAGAVSALSPPSYHSSTRVLVGTCAEGSIEQAYQCGMFTKDRALSYAALVTSDVLAQRVVDDLQLNVAANDVASKITATAEPETALIEITVTDHDPDEARRMADSAGRQFVQMVGEVELRNSGQQSNPFTNLTIVEAAKVAAKTGSSTLMNLVFGALAGLLVGLIAALVRDRLDTRVGSAGSIENTGVPVLAEPTHDASVSWTDGDQRVEEFRRLRMSVAESGRVVTVVGARTPEAAFATAVDLGRAASEAGARMLLVNADMRTGKGFAAVPTSHQGLADLLRQPEMTIAVAERLPTWNSPSIHILGAGTVPAGTTATALLSTGNLPKVLEGLRQEFDIVVVYAAPILDAADAAIVGAATDGAILVVEAGETKLGDVGESVATLHAAGAITLGAVLTTSRRTARPWHRSKR
ncbi:MAG: putative secreted tyrosine kinase [Mycobacterium sp.]|jgi:receptor protein-tyrosine kinase|nr:putative secreted tyrosine kinase [Mycobacterium sp.]